ncbi:hypothetical protein C8Q74DRAFT_880635 [Fomes fomentarius]|nr:hypothetical protein C8Q74DRAFT_880635 [Fomes fomentarius]
MHWLPRVAPSRSMIHAQESRHWTVAPMPLREFMNDSLPSCSSERSTRRRKEREYVPVLYLMAQSENLKTVLKSDPLSRKELAYAGPIIEVTGDLTQDFFVDSETLEDAIEEERTSHELPTSSNDSRFGDFVDIAWG